MQAAEYILDGLEKALRLERDLGVETIEVDALPCLEALAEKKPRTAARKVVETPPRQRYDFVFLHDKPLTDEGNAMMAKIILALGRTAEAAPIVVAKPVPKATAYVIMGARALRQFLPGMKAEPGQWIRTPGGRAALVTYSPEYILRFGAVTPAVQRIKEQMWRSLKTLKQHIQKGTL